MQAGGDAVWQAPTARWTLSAMTDVDTLSNDQVAAVKYGGFVANANAFDNRYFSLSVAESEALDPQ